MLKRNIEIDAGTTFRLKVFYREEDGSPIDLTGWRADLHFKSSPRATDPTVAVSSVDSEIEVNSTGFVEAVVSAAKTALLLGKFYYGLRIESAGGEVALLVSGTAKGKPMVPQITV